MVGGVGQDRSADRQPAVTGLAWTPDDRSRPLARRLRRVAAAFPSHIAISDEAQSITYEELLDRAETIAGAIVDHGRSDVVPLLFGHDLSMVVAICGAWLAQTPYVALDSSYPLPSLERVLSSAGGSLILANESTRPLAELLGDAGRRVIDIDALPPVDRTRLDDEVDLPADAVNALFYTSGSTGAPKGVMRTDHYLLFRTAFEAHTAGFGPEDRIAALRPFVHGASSTALTNALLNGGTLSLYRPRDRGAHGISEFIRQQRITEMSVPVMLLRAWADLTDGEQFRIVRQVGVASGRTMWKDVEAIRRLCPNATVRSGYSSAETGFVARLRVEPTMRFPGPIVPVGTLMPETSLTLVDVAGDPVPAGEPGRALVTSPYLARGYWNDLDATNAVFSPAEGDPNQRTFRTGDLLRWNEEGLLEFVDRHDSRARIRGHRVSPEFVAMTLAQQETVADAFVVVGGSDAGEELVAFYTPSGRSAAPPAEVRRSLASTLPHFMIPSKLIPMEALPALPNGKVDRVRLARLATESVEGAQSTHVWNDEIEERIATLWSDALGVSGFGPDAGWLDLGGDSLTAMHVAGRIAQEYDSQVALGLLLSSATVPEVAKAVAMAGRAHLPGSATSVIPRLPDHEAAPLSYGQEGIWIHQMITGDATRYVMPRVLELRGRLDVGVLRESMERIVERHDVMRSIVTFDGMEAGSLLRPAAFDLPIEATMHDADAMTLLHEEAQRPFDLESERLLRARLVRLSSDHHVLVMAHHHIASDRSSSRILLRELGDLHASLAAGLEPVLPTLPLSYRDFAAWERGWLSGPVLERNLAHWRALLEGRPRAAQFAGWGDPRSSGSERTFIIGAERWRELSSAARGEGVTPFVGFLGVLGMAVSTVTEGADVVVGTTVSRRSRPELEGIVGYFVDQLPVVLPTTPGGSWRSAVRHAGRSVSDAFQYRDAPFSQIARVVGTSRSTDGQALLDISLTWDDEERGLPDFGDVQVAAIQNRGQPSRAAVEIVLRRHRDGARCTLGFGESFAQTPLADRLSRALENALDMAGRPDEAFRTG